MQCEKPKRYLKKQEILNKYKYSMPVSTITIPNKHFRILCKEYKVRYRLPPFYSTIKPIDFIILLNKRKELANIIQNKIKEKWINYTQNLIDIGEECPICYEKFSNTNYPTITLCMHSFCHTCLKLHLKHNYNCPICRSYVILNLIDDKYWEKMKNIQFNYRLLDRLDIQQPHIPIPIIPIDIPIENQMIIQENETNLYLYIQILCKYSVFMFTLLFFSFTYLVYTFVFINFVL